MVGIPRRVNMIWIVSLSDLRPEGSGRLWVRIAPVGPESPEVGAVEVVSPSSFAHGANVSMLFALSLTYIDEATVPMDPGDIRTMAWSPSFPPTITGRTGVAKL